MPGSPRARHVLGIVALLAGVLGAAASAGVYEDLIKSHPSLVAYWRLGESAPATTAADEAAPPYNGQYQGGTTLEQPGAPALDPDTAVHFDGSSGRVVVPYNAAVNPATFTLEVWARVDGGAGTWRSPVTCRDHNPGQQGYILYAANDNLWRFWLGTGGGWAGNQGPPVQVGAWTHLVGTFDGTTQRLYVNGHLADSDPATYQQNTASNFHIGAGGDDGTSFHFPGLLDEVALYNAPLTVQQVWEHFHAALPPRPGPLFRADFANPGGAGLGPDASALTFAGRTGDWPTPSNPDGTLVLGGGGSGGCVYTQDLPSALLLSRPLVVETEAFYQGGAPAPGDPGASNAYLGLKVLHLMGTSASGPERRGGLFAQFRAYDTGAGRLRLGFQSAGDDYDGNPDPDPFDLWHDHAATLDVTGVPDPDGLFLLQLGIYGMDDGDFLIFTVRQGAWSEEIVTTIGAYRNALGDIPAAQAAFDLVLSELRAEPWTMDFGFLSTSSALDAYNHLTVYGFTPEPASLTLFGLGGLALVRRRRRRRKAAGHPAERRHGMRAHIPRGAPLALLAALGLALAAAPAQAAVVAQWQLDEPAGTSGPGSVIDSVDGHHGTPTGTITFGVPGAQPWTATAASYNTGSVDVPYAAALNPATFTYTTWARATGGANTYRSPVTSRLSVPAGTNQGYILYAASNNNWEFWTGDDAGNSWDSLGGGPVTLNAWTHLAISYNAATSAKTIWVDGNLIGGTFAQQYDPNATTGLHIGGGGDAGTQYRFVGDLDHAALYNHELNTSTLRRLMATNRPLPAPFEPQLVANFDIGNEGVLYSGAGPAGTPQAWTKVNTTNPTLGANGVSAQVFGGVGFSTPNAVHELMDDYYYGAASGNFRISGLKGSHLYDIYLVAPNGTGWSPDNVYGGDYTIGALTETATGGITSFTGWFEGREYALFMNVAPVNGVIQGTFNRIDGQAWTGLAGIQVVAIQIPEPGTLIVLGGGLLAVARRRRRFARRTGTAALTVALGLALAAAPAQAGVYSNTVLADGPVAYWRLNEAAGASSAANATGPQHSGSYLGGVTQERPGALFGDPDPSVYFDGSTGKVDVGYSAELNPAGSFGFECWAKPAPGAGTGHRSPVTSRNDGPQEGYIFYAQAGRWQFWSGPGWDNLPANPGSAVEGLWSHLVGTYDAGTGVKRIYVDGQLHNTSPPGVTLNPNSSRPLRIGAGASEGPGNYWFMGDVDEVAVYDYLLSGPQVAAHYSAARPAIPPMTFSAGFENPGGAGLGPDAAALTFAGRTGGWPSPTNPDGTLILGGNGTGGLVYTRDLDGTLAFHHPLVVETEAFYNGGAPGGSNSYMGLKALHRMGTSASGADRRGGLFAQFRADPSGSGVLRLGFQSAGDDYDGNPDPDPSDVWHDHAARIDLPAGTVPDPDGLFTLQLALYGLQDPDAIVFTVTQGSWIRQISTTIGAYRNALGDIPAAQQCFDLVLADLRAEPWTMDFGFISTSSANDAYNFLRVYANVPEPGTLGLLALGGLALARRRRRT